jgi:hypothetical protein
MPHSDLTVWLLAMNSIARGGQIPGTYACWLVLHHLSCMQTSLWPKQWFGSYFHSLPTQAPKCSGVLSTTMKVGAVLDCAVLRHAYHYQGCASLGLWCSVTRWVHTCIAAYCLRAVWAFWVVFIANWVAAATYSACSQWTAAPTHARCNMHGVCTVHAAGYLCCMQTCFDQESLPVWCFHT